MNFTVINKEISVGRIQIIGVASSSIFLVGDTKEVTAVSIIDTPPEAVTIGPFVPLSEE